LPKPKVEVKEEVISLDKFSCKGIFSILLTLDQFLHLSPESFISFNISSLLKSGLFSTISSAKASAAFLSDLIILSITFLLDKSIE
jgi:hypothetical protein